LAASSETIDSTLKIKKALEILERLESEKISSKRSSALILFKNNLFLKYSTSWGSNSYWFSTATP
jgi:hypothetical protein